MKLLLSLLGLILLFSLLLVFGVKTFRQKIDSTLSIQPGQTLMQPTPTPTSPAAKKIDETLFVPYWSLNSKSLPPYQTLVYFGIKVGNTGIDRTDVGYTKLNDFTKASSGQEKLLAIRMIDSSTNFAVLKDRKVQDAVIEESIQIAKKNNFNGILLNIEVSALPFASLIDQITVFNATFASRVHKSGLSYSITAYGDNFYRVRPFDLKKIAGSVDSVYIMAYDFHKAKGNPGPNFPLHGAATYGYDYEHMINNFADSVPLKKLIVVFGMYGYDWQVDDKGIAKDTGGSVALADIKATIIDSCSHILCEWERDMVSAETKATYQDSDGGKHTVWFEDSESVKRKQEFLKSRGIGSYAYWAYSYF